MKTFDRNHKIGNYDQIKYYNQNFRLFKMFYIYKTLKIIETEK